MNNIVIIPRWKKWRLRHRLEMNCIECGVHFDYPANVKDRKYCSNKCQHKSLLGRKETEEHKRKIGIGIKASDKYREALKVRSYPVNGGQFKKGHLAGESHPNWKGGITSVNEKIRKSKEYKEWRDKVFARDNYTCQSCGLRGVTLNADHKKPFAYYPELRLDINNGRTLCVECHRKTDTFMWRSRWV